MAGSVAFLGVLIFFDRELATWWQMRGRRVKTLLLVIVVLPGAIGVLPAGLWAAASWHRDNSFPALCTFDSTWDNWFWDTEKVEFLVIGPPAGWNKRSGDRVARLTFLPGEFPSFTCLG